MSPPEPRREVLVVEDDLDLQDAIVSALRDASYTAYGAVNGLEALTMLRGGLRPGLILLDLMMPVMDGWQLYGNLRATPSLAGIPIAVFTAAGPFADNEKLDIAVQLRKPVDLQVLLDVVRRLCV